MFQEQMTPEMQQAAVAHTKSKSKSSTAYAARKRVVELNEIDVQKHSNGKYLMRCFSNEKQGGIISLALYHPTHKISGLPFNSRCTSSDVQLYFDNIFSTESISNALYIYVETLINKSPEWKQLVTQVCDALGITFKVFLPKPTATVFDDSMEIDPDDRWTDADPFNISSFDDYVRKRIERLEETVKYNLCVCESFNVKILGIVEKQHAEINELKNEITASNLRYREQQNQIIELIHTVEYLKTELKMQFK